MKTKITIIIVLIILISGFALYPKNKKIDDVEAPVSMFGAHTRAQVSLNGSMFNAFVADNEILHQNGLSGFKSLSDKELMLFVFDTPAEIGFWMKDMLFSLDIVWVDSDMRVISIEKNISPSTFPKVFYPSAPAKYVLEFAAGTTHRLGTKIGDTISVSGGK